MELIDRRKLVSDFWQGVADCAILSFEDTDELMENAPTVDAVEVVRCKDCQMYCPTKIASLYKSERYCTRTGLFTREDDFCSYGERKDND